MIFTGDTSLPGTKDAIELEIPNKLSEKWIINLEGHFSEKSSIYLKDKLVVNSVGAIEQLSTKLNVPVALNNNHIFDNNNFNETKQNLDKLGLKSFGAGSNNNEASKYH